MIFPLVAQPRIKAHRDLSDSFSLNFPNKTFSLMDIPSSKPAALVRLPPVASAILAANSRKDREHFSASVSSPQQGKALSSSNAKTPQTQTDDEHTSEADSSAPPHSGLSASTSTLETVETAETELTPPESAIIAKPLSGKKKAKQAATEKRKRRREKERLSKQVLLAQTQESSENTQQAPNEEALSDEENDSRSAAMASFRKRSHSTSSSGSSVLEKAEEKTNTADAPVPQASTSKLIATVPVPAWADDLPEDEEVPQHDFNTLSSSMNRIEDSRRSSRRGSKISLHNSTPASLSRRASHASEYDRFGAHSPASSQGGWQEVPSKVAKKTPQLNLGGLRPNNAFIKRSVMKEPLWTHDKYEEARSNDHTQAKAIPSRVQLSPEFPWTARSPFPFLFNEPGSRLQIDEKTGQRKMTIRICLKPIPDIFTTNNRRLARQRAGAVEVNCILNVEPPPTSLPPPLSEDIIIVVRLDCKATPFKLATPAAQKRKTSTGDFHIVAAQPGASIREDVAHPSIAQICAELQQADAQASTSAPALGSGYTTPKSGTHTPATMPFEQDPSAQLRSVLNSPEANRSASHVPSVEEQMAMLDAKEAQQRQQFANMPQYPHIDGSPMDGYYPNETYPFPVPFPMYHEPFIGMDGLTYYFDPATGQSLPGPPLAYPPPGYPIATQETPPPHTSTPFFAPRKSHKLEIKAPTPESLVQPARSKPRQHRTIPSASVRNPTEIPTEEAVLSDFAIPGSYEMNGAVYFGNAPFMPYSQAPPQYFYGTVPPQNFVDPAIISLSSPYESSALDPALEQQNPVETS